MYILLHYRLSDETKNKFVVSVQDINELEQQLDECEEIKQMFLSLFIHSQEYYFKFEPLNRNYMIITENVAKNVHTGEELPVKKSMYAR
jgi:hypothetical protein